MAKGRGFRPRTATGNDLPEDDAVHFTGMVGGSRAIGVDAPETAAIGERVGPDLAHDAIAPAFERLFAACLDLRRDEGKTFLDTCRRLGPAPFKAALYPEEAYCDAA